MTNYFKVSRGVRQGCPLSPFLFILAVEILACKIRKDPGGQGIFLPNGQEVKLSQFADDITLIARDAASLTCFLRNIDVFGNISGLKLNKKKTKAMWIGASKNSSAKILNFSCTKDPIKSLGTYLSYYEDKNNEENFVKKIRKMKTKINLWLTRALTLYGRAMLTKTIDISQLVYTASMLCVPETVIKSTQVHLFNFLWKNKNDKVKRQVIYQPLSGGGLDFPNFRIMVQSLRLAWLGRLLSETNDTWKAIPSFYFDKYGGLAFLLNCNYNVSKINKNLPLFYREILEYFNAVKKNTLQETNSKFILWNNQNITIDGNPVYWKSWIDGGILCVHDLLNSKGNFLSFNEFQRKFQINTNFLQYFQLLSAIPTDL